MVDRRRNRLLKDIDSALNQSNHDLLLIPSKTEEIGVELEKNKNTTKKIFWAIQKPNLFGKQCRENGISKRSRAKPEPIDETWSLFFFYDGIIKHIATCTNQCICEKVASMSESTKES